MVRDGRATVDRMVDHHQGQYVVGAVHTQTIEGFWSLIKRGVMGSYHKVSKKYLPLYVAEFSFRYNNREVTDAERFVMAMRQIVGRRLTYKQLIGKQEVSHDA